MQIAVDGWGKVPRCCGLVRNCLSQLRVESYGSCCMKVANGALPADFSHFGTDDFPFKIPFKKSDSKSSFFRLGVEIQFWSFNLCSLSA